jgi:TonB family protein
MATVVPLPRNAVAPGAFVEALNGLAVGLVTLDFTRRALAAAVAADPAVAADVRALLDESWENGRLGAEDYEALARDLGRELGEDLPTEWSVDAAAAPPADDPAATGPQRALRLVPGTVLRERFVLEERLDSGGMCEVFRARDRRREESGAANPHVALKLVGPRTPRFAEALRLLQQEAALAHRLDHPNVARVHDFDRDGDYAFVTADWLDGENLGDILTRERYRPLPLAQARRILEEAGAALAFAHAQGIVHADVKPGNVFVTREGRAKLLDFGVARAAGEGGAAAARTPAYASCEVLEGAAPTAQDDVYSLACVAYRMLAGRRAFGHHDALAAEKAGRAPARIPALSEAQWGALARALAFRRADRTPDVETFVAGLRGPGKAPGLVAGQGPRVPATAAVAATAADAPVGAAIPATPAEQAPRTASSRRGFVAGLALGALVAVGVALLWPRGDEPAAPATAAVVDGAPVVPVAPDAGTGAAAPARAEVAEARAAAGADPAPDPKREDGATARIAAAEPRESPRAAAPAATTAVRAVTPVPAVRSGDDAPLPAAEASPATVASTPAATQATAPAAGAAPAGAMGGTADTVVAGPRQVPLSALSFRRYVEPRVRNTARDPAPEGWVEVVFVVGEDGRPRGISVTDSSPPGRYDTVAIAAVEKWRFEPPLEAGAPVARRTGVRLRFEPE